MSKYVSKQNLNTIVQEMGKKIPSILNLTNEELQEIIDAFNPEFVPEDEDTNVGGVPLAAILPWVDDVNNVPAGFLKCDGMAVSRTTYSDLFGAIGTKYGSGDGSTTFNTPDLTDAAILNGTYDKTTFTTAGSATFTAPKDGYYKITVKGGGGGGAGGYRSSGSLTSGGGGGEGGLSIGFEYMNTSDTATIIIGAGGTGGAAGSNAGTAGGNSSVTVNANTYTGGGGAGGGGETVQYGGGAGGTGTIIGASGGSGQHAGTSTYVQGGVGGGNGGGNTRYEAAGNAGTSGGGGAGGTAGASSFAGGNGGDGYVWIEYIGTASQYIIKYTPTVIDSEVSAATSASQAQAAAQAAESYAGSAGIPVGTLFPFAADTQTPPTGFLFCNGQAVSRTMYADLFSVIGTTYGPGDGSTTFNLPDEEFLKGMAGMVPVVMGSSYNYVTHAYMDDDRKGHQVIDYSVGGTGYASHFLSDNKVPYGSTDNIGDFNTGTGSFVSPYYADISDATPEYSSNIHYIIKAYDGVTPGSAGIDLSQYASDLSNKASRGLDNLTDAGKDRFLGDDNFCIIYPNGGTEANPANVTTNSRYVESNPFPGYIVGCILEVYVDNLWGITGYGTDEVGSYRGATASQLNNDTIVIQVGDTYVRTGPSVTSGDPFGKGVGTAASSLPCRVKVWKIGKVSA